MCMLFLVCSVAVHGPGLMPSCADEAWELRGGSWVLVEDQRGGGAGRSKKSTATPQKRGIAKKIDVFRAL